MDHPLTFSPIFKERVWGGRRLATVYEKALPENALIGESWEITDRPEAVSVVSKGPHQGIPLRALMEDYRHEILGCLADRHDHFPLLVKILDAREKLSLQVHPPQKLAAELQGEPKTEMWYVADAEPHASVYAGLKQGVTKDQFSYQCQDGTVADCFHEISVKRGDCLFLESGRVHALGGGNLIFEIQQNSDTTYRVFDWNRVGLDGKPRDLHISESLQAIDFDDFEPTLERPEVVLSEPGLVMEKLISDNRVFSCHRLRMNADRVSTLDLKETPAVIACLEGHLQIHTPKAPVSLRPGDFALVPAAAGKATFGSDKQASCWLFAQPTG